MPNDAADVALGSGAIVAAETYNKYTPCSTIFVRWPNVPNGILMMNKVWETYGVILKTQGR
jgi:hypothetical protein